MSLIRCLFEIGHIICCFRQITVGWFTQLLVIITVGWSLSRQDKKVNRIAGMSDTLPIGKTRYSDKEKTVCQNHRQGKKIIFWRKCSFPFATILLCPKKAPPSVLNEILKTDIYTCSVYAVNCFVFDDSFPSVVCFRSRQRLLCRRERKKVFGLNTSERGRFCPERHSRLTFLLSIESVLT